MIDLSKEKLELDYPCNWCYKVVVLKDEDISKVASEVLLDKTHKITKSKTSSKGKFQSYNIDLVVDNEQERLNLFDKFKKHKNTKMVI